MCSTWLQEKNESKIWTKDVSCKFKCKFNEGKCNSDQNWNNDKCWFEYKKHHLCEKDYIWNLASCSCKNGKYLASIIGNSLIPCDKIIEKEKKAVPANFNEKNTIFEAIKF